jgi:hypothetical protein
VKYQKVSLVFSVLVMICSIIASIPSAEVTAASKDMSRTVESPFTSTLILPSATSTCEAFEILPGRGNTLVLDWTASTTASYNIHADFKYAVLKTGTPVAWADDPLATQHITITSAAGGRTVTCPAGGFGAMSITLTNQDTSLVTITKLNVGSF